MSPHGEADDFEQRSLYFACTRCGAMVCADDRERHRRFHQQVRQERDEAERQ